jgi:hypothetical protein
MDWFGWLSLALIIIGLLVALIAFMMSEQRAGDERVRRMWDHDDHHR